MSKTPIQLAVNEVFGPTIQGEGPSMGRRAYFIRLAMCNLKCVWCDTKYTWDWQHYDRDTEIHLMTIPEIFKRFSGGFDAPSDMLVISGGEPMLQWRALATLCDEASDFGGGIEIETNGTVEPQSMSIPHASDYIWNEVRFNVSPKLHHSGNERDKAFTEALYWYVARPQSIFKFVCKHSGDLLEVAAIQAVYKIPNERIWIMPEGTEPGVIDNTLHRLADEVIRRGWNLTTRMHVQLWGNKRAR